jgi:Sigma-70, region 4
MLGGGVGIQGHYPGRRAAEDGAPSSAPVPAPTSATTHLVVGRGARLRVARGVRGQHAVQLGDVEVGIPDHRVVRRVALRFLDVGCPPGVVGGWIGRQPDDLDVPAVKLGFDIPLVLTYMDGWATKEVARMLDLPLGTVLAQLHRGRKLFEKRLWEYAETHGLLKEPIR